MENTSLLASWTNLKSKFSWRYFDYSHRDKDFRSTLEHSERNLNETAFTFQLVLICYPDYVAGVPADGSLPECDPDRAAHP